jgi:hypothetical protein
MLRLTHQSTDAMAFHITHRFGDDEPDPRLAAFRALLREIREDADAADAVGVTHDSGWAVCVSGRGVVTLENFELPDIAPRRLPRQSDATIVSLFEAVADGRFDDLLAHPWEETSREPSRARDERARAPALRPRSRCPSQRPR